MDKSKEYVDMCLGNGDIQNGHVWEEGDLFYHIVGDSFHYVTEEMINYGEMDCACCAGKRVWLPRQDQLQDLVPYHRCAICHTVELGEFVDVMLDRWEESCWMPSMEKLWLCLVMRYSFKKTWNGKYWVV